MINLKVRRRNQITVSQATDTVLFGVSLPSDSVVHGLTMRVSMQTTLELSRIQAAYYGVEGYVLPIHDVDAVLTYDQLWDILVPKDSGTGSIDLDSGTADTQNFFEPGDPSFAALLDAGFRPRKIYGRYRMLNPGSPGSFNFIDTATPFTPLFIPGDLFVQKLKGPFRVSRPSVLVIAVSSPVLDDVVTTLPVLTEFEWDQIKYIGHVLERALISLFSLVEAGAETPWDEATALLVKQLEPQVLEVTSGAYATVTTWTVFGELMLSMSVPGRMDVKSVTTAR